MAAPRRLVAGLRAVERTQVGEMMRRAYLGLKALPAAGQSVSAMGREWWMDVLGVDHEASFETVRTAYRRMARTSHPDAGGSHARMSLVNAAWKEAEAYFIRETVAS